MYLQGCIAPVKVGLPRSRNPSAEATSAAVCGGCKLCAFARGALPHCECILRGAVSYDARDILKVSDARKLLSSPHRHLRPHGGWSPPQAFEFAYKQLGKGGGAEDSLLERVIRLDSVLVDRPRAPALPDYAAPVPVLPTPFPPPRHHHLPATCRPYAQRD